MDRRRWHRGRPHCARTTRRALMTNGRRLTSPLRRIARARIIQCASQASTRPRRRARVPIVSVPRALLAASAMAHQPLRRATILNSRIRVDRPRAKTARNLTAAQATCANSVAARAMERACAARLATTERTTSRASRAPQAVLRRIAPRASCAKLVVSLRRAPIAALRVMPASTNRCKSKARARLVAAMVCITRTRLARPGEPRHGRAGTLLQHTTCTGDQYETKAPTTTSTVRRQHLRLQDGGAIGEYETGAPTDTSDRSCAVPGRFQVRWQRQEAVWIPRSRTRRDSLHAKHVDGAVPQVTSAPAAVVARAVSAPNVAQVTSTQPSSSVMHAMRALTRMVAIPCVCLARPVDFRPPARRRAAVARLASGKTKPMVTLARFVQAALRTRKAPI